MSSPKKKPLVENSPAKEKSTISNSNPEMENHQNNLQSLKNEQETHGPPQDIEHLEQEILEQEPENLEMALQQSLARKRDLKGSYKLKLPLEQLIVDHERKKVQLAALHSKNHMLKAQLDELRVVAGKKAHSELESKGAPSKTHHEFLIKEMLWMQADFGMETRKKLGDAKKSARMVKKELQERQVRLIKQAKDQKVELRKRANLMSKMVQTYWRSVEKIVKHNYSVQCEKKKQAQRQKKLENFVSKHLKLSATVAEELNTKSFIEQSMFDQGTTEQDPSKNIVKLYGEKDAFEEKDKKAKEEDDKQITDIGEQVVKMAEAFQPKANILEQDKEYTKVPFLLRAQLREYQIVGLDWLVTLHNKKLNGILADEMGLGKTVQTIAMLASLACDKGVWGPHLIVVPTTILMNWEMEFKRFCPAFKVLTYFGSQKERKQKRQGWSKENSFHVCITSYKLVIQDQFAFRRKKWYYMVLDEAQNIKNFKSQRWQTLLRFNTRRRLLLTGTPLQNDVMELWSLMHFLMPQIFSSQQDFKEWFSNPFSQSINQNQSLSMGVVQKLQSILRPFLLRRMKKDVEKQLPEKIEHIVQCNLSRRQRLLYDEYMNQGKTRDTLAQSDFFSIMNVLMQLRKVCNHPDLFESRTIESPFVMTNVITQNLPQLIHKNLIYLEQQKNPLDKVCFSNLDLHLPAFEHMSWTAYETSIELFPSRSLVQPIYEHSKNGAYHISDTLVTYRPGREGRATSTKNYSCSNVLQESNTQNLKLTVPKILPITGPADQVPESLVPYPNYLNVACLPFAQQFFNLKNFEELRTASSNTQLSDTVNYECSLTSLEQKQKKLALAKKLVAFAHFDWVNRMRLINQKPIYGSDLRAAVQINLLLTGDIHANRRHTYVDRRSKTCQWKVNECAQVPSAVFNSASEEQLRFEGTFERSNGCQVEDFSDMTEEQIEEYNRSNPLIQELTETQQRIKAEEKLRRQREEEERRQKQQEDRLLAQQNALREAEARLRLLRIEQAKYKEVQVEVEVEEEAGENGCILSVNLGEDRLPHKEGGDNPNVRAFSLQKVIKLEKRERSHPLSILSELEAQEQGQQEVDEDEQVEAVTEGDHKEMEHGEGVDVEMDNVESAKEDDQAEQGDKGDQVMQEEQHEESPLAEPSQPHQQENQPEEAPLEKNLEDAKVEQNIEQQEQPVEEIPEIQYDYQIGVKNCDVLREMVVTPLQRAADMDELIKQFKTIIPKVVAKPPVCIPTRVDTKHEKDKAYERFAYQKLMSHRNVNQSLKLANILFFPHKNLIQYDCGKLQRLAQLLKTLYLKGSKVLIFTQMTRMLDVLENFLNLHGYSYVRLDGSVKVEARQKMVDKFNMSPKLFCFISSTRCGGIGINLTGADCVIFYDTDWNPAMDKQAQDRSHRIGQTKTVHIYRLISVNTIEENIFKKSLQKRELGGLIIEGNFSTEFFQKVSMKDLLEGCDDMLKPKRKNIMDEENIVFHHHTHGAQQVADGQQAVADMESQRALEAYRKRFEDAMIRIEDEEDVDAYREAKAEIDDEFDEQEDQAAAMTPATKAPEEEVQADVVMQEDEEQKQDGDALELEKVAAAAQAEQRQKQEAVDKKNATGAAKDLKKSELIDWQNHPTLNVMTKTAIQYFQEHFSYENYMEELVQKEMKTKKGGDSKQDDQKPVRQEASEVETEEEEQSEEEINIDWDRNMAEALYMSTVTDLEHRVSAAQTLSI